MYSSLAPRSYATDVRDVKEVPFVELFEQRLQGVVSSGSDIARVYVAFIEAKTLDFSCSTNNNRPCGGLNANYPCSHLRGLLAEALIQFGAARVARFLQTDTADLHSFGQKSSQPSGMIFTRFLSQLALLELPPSHDPLPTVAWF